MVSNFVQVILLLFACGFHTRYSTNTHWIYFSLQLSFVEKAEQRDLRRFSKWSFVQKVVSQQKNDKDCGVFVGYFIQCSMARRKPDSNSSPRISGSKCGRNSSKTQFCLTGSFSRGRQTITVARLRKTLRSLPGPTCAPPPPPQDKTG